MTVWEAMKKSRRMKWLGLAVMLIGFTQLLMAAVLSIYDFGEQLKASFLNGLGYELQNLSLIVYRATSFLQVLWDATPRLDVNQPLTLDTLMLVGIMVIIATGAYIRGAGIQLSNDIAAIRKKARDELWLRSMLPPERATAVINQPASVTVLSLQMPPGEIKNWWERPLGIILIGLASTYIAALLTRISGLT
ncbi:YniB family protein [Pseudomonas sp. RC10]|uniref:YniB family protein n=1 Tax=Pseudomonas bambusae TaxID=3139142 RepID=UPI0031394678